MKQSLSQAIWTDPLIWGQPKSYGVAEFQSKKKRIMRKIVLAQQARKGHTPSSETAKHPKRQFGYSMKITLENTRALGVGETVLPDDFYLDMVAPEERLILPVAQPEVGKIISEDETTEYRRLIGSNPYDAMIAELGLETEAGKNAFRVFCEFVQVLDRKQQDYGSGNISAFGEFGIVVRLNDKIERLKRLINAPVVKNEPVDDTYLDIANYSVIAMLIRRNLWK